MRGSSVGPARCLSSRGPGDRSERARRFGIRERRGGSGCPARRAGVICDDVGAGRRDLAAGGGAFRRGQVRLDLRRARHRDCRGRQRQRTGERPGAHGVCGARRCCRDERDDASDAMNSLHLLGTSGQNRFRQGGDSVGVTDTATYVQRRRLPCKGKPPWAGAAIPLRASCVNRCGGQIIMKTSKQAVVEQAADSIAFGATLIGRP